MPDDSRIRRVAHGDRGRNGGGNGRPVRCARAMPGDDAGCIPVTSFLGATMLGMQALQKAPLLREDGWIDTLVVLDVCGA